MMVYGRSTNKLDFLGTISIYNYEYFNVFRRYNNVHEIVVEDYNADLHFIKNETLRQTLEGILCLSEEQTKNLYIQSAFSFKHQSEIAITQDMVELTWSDIQHMWGGLVLNMGGILEDYHRVAQTYQSPTPSVASVPDAPRKCRSVVYQNNGVKRQRLSDRFAEMEEARMKDEQEEEQEEEEQEEEEQEEEQEQEQEQEDNYMELRSGTVYYKK
jgi:hypothetical protein